MNHHNLDLQVHTPWNKGKLVGQKPPLNQKVKRFNIHGRIASDYNWARTMYLAFYNNYKYYGPTGYGRGGRDIRRELRENDIDYYFVWSPNFTMLPWTCSSTRAWLARAIRTTRLSFHHRNDK